MSIERELGWDDTIEDDEVGFEVLAPGEYPFRVVSMTRGRFTGSEKLPACNKAELAIDILDPTNRVSVVGKINKHSLFLHTKTKRLLCEFFRGIGALKSGEEVAMNWASVPGSVGWCKIGNRPYVDKGGEKKIANEIKGFIDPAETSDEPGF